MEHSHCAPWLRTRARSVPRGTQHLDNRGSTIQPKNATTAALEALLASGLDELGLESSLRQRQQLARLCELLTQWSGRMNLSGHRDADTTARRLILDAAAVGKALVSMNPSTHSLADLGSGAGFPGLPLAILWPGLSVQLVEARERRVHFQRAAIRELELQGVTASLGRAETLEVAPAATVTAQAMARPAVALEFGHRWLAPGGVIAIPTGQGRDLASDFEVSAAALGLSAERQSYQVPLGGPRRALLIARSSNRVETPI